MNLLGFLNNKNNNKVVPEVEDIAVLKKQLEAVQVVSHELIVLKDLNDILGTIVNQIGNQLDYINPVIYILNKDKQTYSVKKLNVPQSIVNLTSRLVGKSIYDVKFSIKDDNLLTRVLLKGELSYSNSFHEVFKPFLKPASANIVQNILRIKNVIAAPIKVKSESIGVLTVGSRNSVVKESEIKIIGTFSDQISNAIFNTKQYDLLHQKNDELEALFSLTSNISQTLDPEKVLQSAVDTIPTSESLIGAAVALYDETTKKITVKAATESELGKKAREIMGNYDAYAVEVENPEQQNNLLVKVVKSGKAASTANFTDIVTPPLPGTIAGGLQRLLRIDNTMVLPLKSKGFTIGVIMFYQRNAANKENSESDQLLNTYAFQISIALENAQLYKKSQEIQASLIEARRRERDMIDVMGHELRTPISIVRNALLTLDMDFKKDNQIDDMPKLGKYLDMAIESTKREIRLIETLLSATKVEGNKMQLLLTKVDMLDVINDAIEGQAGIAKDKNTGIKFELPAGKEFFAYADRVRTQEIMDNFLSNAVKYTDKGIVEIYIWEENEYIFIETKDTGIGISAEDLQNLGKKFFRAKELFDEKPGNVQPSGTGLGLFVTFSLIDIMHGKRIIESEKGKGSRFVFALPRYTGQADKEEQQALIQNGVNE